MSLEKTLILVAVSVADVVVISVAGADLAQIYHAPAQFLISQGTAVAYLIPQPSEDVGRGIAAGYGARELVYGIRILAMRLGHFERVAHHALFVVQAAQQRLRDHVLVILFKPDLVCHRLRP